jgi:isopenicillin N synthase-like dioxygenase
MTQVGIRLLRAFAEALQLPENAFDRLYGDPTSISN